MPQIVVKLISQATIKKNYLVRFLISFFCWLHVSITRTKSPMSVFCMMAQPTVSKNNEMYTHSRTYIKRLKNIKRLRKLTSTEFARLATVILNQLISVSDVNLCRAPFRQCLTEPLVACSAFGQYGARKGSFAWHAGWISVYACCR